LTEGLTLNTLLNLVYADRELAMAAL